MEHLRDLRLLDEDGHPVNARIASALDRLVPRFRKQFPTLRDEADLADILEEAGRKIAHRERQIGPIDRLHGYAWVTLRHIAASWVRRGSGRLRQHTLNSHESEIALASLPAEIGTPDQIEHAILIREIETQLTAIERMVLGWKKAGFSSEEIAQFRGTSIGAVDALFSRAKHKIRALLRVQQYGGTAGERSDLADGNVKHQPSRDEADVERRDDEITPAARRFQSRRRR